MNDQTQKSLAIVRTYIKDVSVECPNSPEIFGTGGETQFKIDIKVDAKPVWKDHTEVSLTLTTTAQLGEKTLFLIEVTYGGLFNAVGFADAEMEQILQIWAPTQLFPFVRELVASLSSNAGFPQLLLPVINFEQYHEARRNQGQGEPADAGTTVQ